MAQGFCVCQVINGSDLQVRMIKQQAKQRSADPAKTIYTDTDLFQFLGIRDEKPRLGGVNL